MKEELYKMRRMGWIMTVAPYQDPKRLRGKNEKTWWPLDEEQTITDELRERGRKAMEEYIKQINGRIKC